MHLSPCRLWKLRLYETREQNLLLGQPGNWFDSINNALSFQRLLGRLILPRSFLCHWWSCLDLLEREGRRDSGSRLRFGGCRETSSRSRAVARGRAFPSAATTPPVDTQLQISVVYLFDFFWEKNTKKTKQQLWIPGRPCLVDYQFGSGLYLTWIFCFAIWFCFSFATEWFRIGWTDQVGLTTNQNHALQLRQDYYVTEEAKSSETGQT